MFFLFYFILKAHLQLYIENKNKADLTAQIATVLELLFAEILVESFLGFSNCSFSFFERVNDIFLLFQLKGLVKIATLINSVLSIDGRFFLV